MWKRENFEQLIEERKGFLVGILKRLGFEIFQARRMAGLVSKYIKESFSRGKFPNVGYNVRSRLSGWGKTSLWINVDDLFFHDIDDERLFRDISLQMPKMPKKRQF